MVLSENPLPPPADVIVEKVETEPGVAATGPSHDPVPPAPSVTGIEPIYAVIAPHALTKGDIVGAAKHPAQFDNLNPPAPPPPE